MANIGDVLKYATPLVVPVVTAVVNAAGIVIKDRWGSRSFEQRRRHQLANAQMQVDFVHGWLQARKLLGPLGNTSEAAQDWLDSCYRSVEGAEPAPVPRRAVTWRRVFLLGPLSSPRARLARRLFWVATLLANIVAIENSIEVLLHKGTKWGETLGDVLFYLVLALIFRVWCTLAERSARSQEAN
ncbi:hypothetical protein [Streptomyces hygroscopicus]|uniref:hypothetical protein n=1 Tax=Streptomyces hygroscopicus TaxID=1912 RepID=UPI00223FA403|nr:hypothetical protein [Streptomyces hygroscopicus]